MGSSEEKYRVESEEKFANANLLLRLWNSASTTQKMNQIHHFKSWAQLFLGAHWRVARFECAVGHLIVRVVAPALNRAAFTERKRVPSARRNCNQIQ